MRRNGVGQPLVVALPTGFKAHLDAEAFHKAMSAVSYPAGLAPRLIFHQLQAGADKASPGARWGGDLGRRWVFFVDGANVVRMSQRFTGAKAIGQVGLEHWMKVFRDFGDPERTLPTYARPAPSGADSEGEADK